MKKFVHVIVGFKLKKRIKQTTAVFNYVISYYIFLGVIIIKINRMKNSLVCVYGFPKFHGTLAGETNKMLVLSQQNLLMSRKIYPVGYLTFPLPHSVTSGTSLIPCIWYCFDSLLFLCFMLFLLMHLMLYFLNVIVTSAIFFFCWNFLLTLAAPRHPVTRLLATTRTSVPLFITSSSKFQTTRFYSCTKKVQIQHINKGIRLLSILIE